MVLLPQVRPFVRDHRFELLRAQQVDHALGENGDAPGSGEAVSGGRGMVDDPRARSIRQR